MLIAVAVDRLLDSNFRRLRDFRETAFIILLLYLLIGAQQLPSRHYSASTEQSDDPSLRFFTKYIGDEQYAEAFLQRLGELQMEVEELEFKLEEKIAINRRMTNATVNWWLKHGPHSEEPDSLKDLELKTTLKVKIHFTFVI